MALDTTAIFLGYSALTVFIITGLIFAFMYLRGNKHFSTKTRGWSMLISGGVALFAFFAMAGITLLGTASVDSDATYNLTISSDQSFVTIKDDTDTVTTQLDFNFTGNGGWRNQTQYLEINITLDRSDSGTKADTTICQLSDPGSVTDEGEGKVYDLVSEGTTPNVNWTKAQNPDAATVIVTTSKGLSTNLHVESGKSSWVLVNMTFSVDAADAMVPYTVYTAYPSIGGVTVTLNAMVTVYVGTPPS